MWVWARKYVQTVPHTTPPHRKVEDTGWWYRFEPNPSTAKYTQELPPFPTTSCKNTMCYTKFLLQNYILCNVVVESLWSCGNLHVWRQVKVFHVVRAVPFLFHITFSCRAECFYCIQLTFLHLYICIGFYAGYWLTSMNLVWIDWMAVQVLYCLHLMHFTIDLNFIGFHRLLNLFTNFRKSSINTSLFNTRVGGIFHC